MRTAIPIAFSISPASIVLVTGKSGRGSMANFAGWGGRGHRTLSILDVGCGPGTWLRRTVLRARELGFTAIKARGVDISGEMIALAKDSFAQISGDGVAVQF